MGTTLARIKKGDLLLTGQVSERLPAVTKGLVAHFPFDETPQGVDASPMLDYSSWKPGQKGSIGQFLVNGTINENFRVEGTDPWGDPATLWEARPEGISGADGGWNTSAFDVDATKRYRFSVWVNRSVLGVGTFYLGCSGIGAVNGVASLSGTTNTNAYFTSGALPEAEWVLVVGHVHPHDYTGSVSPDSGYYKVSSERYKTVGDFKWLPGTTKATHRSYLYYSTDATTRQVWCYPRVDICDGSEPTIADLLLGEGKVINPSLQSNVTFAEGGIVIEEASENVVKNHGQAEPTPVAGDGGPPIRIVEPNVTFRGRRVTKYRPGSSRNFYINGTSNLSTATLSTAWTATLYLKRIDGQPINSVGSYLYINGNPTNNITVPAEAVEDGWYKIVRNRTGLVSGYPTLFGCHGLEDTEYYIAEWQVEPKAFRTAFVEDKSVASSLHLNDLGGMTEYTVCGTFLPRQPFKNAGGYVESPKSGVRLFHIFDRLTPGEISYRYYESGGALTSSPYLNRTGSYSTGNIHKNYQTDAEKPLFFLIRKTGTSFTFRLYQNGWKEEHLAVVTVGARLDDFQLSSASNLNGVYKDLSIYARYLSDAEVEQNLRKKFSVNGDGNLATPLVRERIPSKTEGILFPFGGDTSSHDQAVQAVQKAEEAYGNEGLWIGNQMRNYAGDGLTAYTSYFTYSRNGDNHLCYRHQGSTSSTLALQSPAFNAVITTGTVYTISGYLYLNGKPFKTAVAHLSSYHTGTTKRESRDDGYFEYTQPFNSGSWIIHNDLCNAQIGDTIEIRNFQIELQAFASAYTPLTRGDSNIALPYSVVDCKKDFTVMGWFYPKAFADTAAYRPFITRNRITSNVTSQRILIMGDGGSSRRLRAWFGSGGTEGSVLAPSTIPITENEWNFFCFRRSGDVVSIFLGVNGKIGYGSSSNGAYLNTEENASTWGWLIGKYSNTSSMAAGYARDYQFIQRALSDAEVESVYRTQMRSQNENALQVQGQIKEGRVL